MRLEEKHCSTEFELEGYKLFNVDRQGRRSGRVALYVKEGINCFIYKSIKTNDNVESILVELFSGKEKLVMGVAYRPPNATDDLTTALLHEIDRASSHSNLYIVGDFNCSNIDWDVLIGDPQEERLIEIIQDNILVQLINELTRINNILDLILCKNDIVATEIKEGGKLRVSDYD